MVNAGVCKTSMQGFDSLPRLWVVSSLVERFSDKEEVDSSILSRPTSSKKLFMTRETGKNFLIKAAYATGRFFEQVAERRGKHAVADFTGEDVLDARAEGIGVEEIVRRRRMSEEASPINSIKPE